MLLLEQDTTRKGWIYELLPKPKPKFDAGNNKEYKIEAIINMAIYAKEAKKYLLGLYYLVFWKSYREKESTWELSSTVMHFRKMISTFYKNHPEIPTATSSTLDFALSIAKLSVKPAKPSTKQKQSRLTNSTK